MEQITASQLAEWEAYDRIDPIGTWRDDYRIAILDALVVNIVSKLYAKKGAVSKEASPMDFMPNWSGDAPTQQKQSVGEMKSALMQLAKMSQRREKENAMLQRRAKIPPSELMKKPSKDT